MLNYFKNRINPETVSFYGLLTLWAGLTFSNAIVEIAFTIALVFWFIHIFKNRCFSLLDLPKPSIISLALFILVVFLSHFWSEARDESLRGIFKVLQNIMIFVMVSEVGRGRIRFMEKFITAVFAIVILNCFYQYCMGTDFLRGFAYTDARAGKRISAAFKTYSQLGSFLILLVPYMFALGLSVRGFTREKLLYWVLTFGGLAGLYLTRSRGAILAFMAGGILFLCLRKKFKLLILVLVGAAVGIAVFVPKSMVIHFDAENKEQSIVERYYLWDRALQVIRAKPLTGTGINTYLATHAKYDTTESTRVVNYYAHNSYLQLGAEIGLPGLAFFLFFLLYTWLWAWQTIRKKLVDKESILPALGLWIGLFNFLLFAAVDTGLNSPQSAMSFWFGFGLLFVYIKSFGTSADPAAPKTNCSTQ